MGCRAMAALGSVVSSFVLIRGISHHYIRLSSRERRIVSAISLFWSGAVLCKRASFLGVQNKGGPSRDREQKAKMTWGFTILFPSLASCSPASPLSGGSYFVQDCSCLRGSKKGWIHGCLASIRVPALLYLPSARSAVGQFLAYPYLEANVYMYTLIHSPVLTGGSLLCGLLWTSPGGSLPLSTQGHASFLLRRVVR